jgi:hypothetical protein
MLDTGPLLDVGLPKLSLLDGDFCIVRGRAGAIETTGRGPIAGCCIATAVMASWRGGMGAIRL